MGNLQRVILNYKDFSINEEFSSIDESMLYMSDDFKDKISSIKSIMSDMILNKELTDIKDDMTFIDLGDGNDRVKFAKIRSVDNLIDNNGIRNIKSDNGTDITLDSGNLPEDIYPKLISKFSEYGGKFSEITLGKFLRKILSVNISNSDIELYVDKFKGLSESKHKSKYTMELINFSSDGKEYEKYFNSSFMKVGSEIHNSCMNDKFSILGLYSKCGKAKLLTLKSNSNNMILGRAVIWDVRDNKLEFDYFMDRIYISTSWVTQYFINHAITKGWAYKETQNYSNKEGIVFNGDVYNKEIRINGNFRGLKRYPYMDTFSFLINNKYLTNYDLDAHMLSGEIDGRDIKDIKTLVDINGGYK